MTFLNLEIHANSRKIQAKPANSKNPIKPLLEKEA